MSARIFVDGNLVADPRCGVSQNGTYWTDLRIASHERVRQDGEWASTDPQFFNVTLFGTAAERAANTLNKGDPVHVEGRVELEEFTRKDGEHGAAIKVYAHSIGMRSVTGHAAETADRDVSPTHTERAGIEQRPRSAPDVVVHHTPDGTAVTGVERNDRDLHVMLKGAGFHWSAKTSRWFLPVTEDEATRAGHVDELVAAAAGADRRLTIVDEPPPASAAPIHLRSDRAAAPGAPEPVAPSAAHAL